ncbi:hypothetical protein BC829DRAFT_418502 [Chytridium lagenaria]|nr:hypothetical protein BC829DRAFT_418502 [Chytridium lagenaria]
MTTCSTAGLSAPAPRAPTATSSNTASIKAADASTTGKERVVKKDTKAHKKGHHKKGGRGKKDSDDDSLRAIAVILMTTERAASPPFSSYYFRTCTSIGYSGKDSRISIKSGGVSVAGAKKVVGERRIPTMTARAIASLMMLGSDQGKDFGISKSVLGSKRR